MVKRKREEFDPRRHCQWHYDYTPSWDVKDPEISGKCPHKYNCGSCDCRLAWNKL